MVWAVSLLGVVVIVCAYLIGSQVAWTYRRDNRFRCKIRLTRGWVPGFDTTWSKRVIRAEWVRDVLLVFRGRAFVRTEGLPVARAEGAVRHLRGGELSRLGRDPVVLDLILDDGARIQIAAPASAQALVCGPYLVAQVQAGRGSQSSK